MSKLKTSIECCLEFSQYSKDREMYPYHVMELDQAIRDNMQDSLYNNRGSNKWQIIFIGSIEHCSNMILMHQEQLSLVDEKTLP